MRSIVALLLAAAMVNAWAEESSWWTGSGLAYHVEKGKNYNWFTAGAGFEKGVSDGWRVAGGFYLNSHRNWSTYLAGVYLPLSKPLLDGTLRAGFIAGGVTGYDKGLMPVAGLALAYEMRGYGMNLIGVPNSAGSPAVLWWQFKVRW